MRDVVTISDEPSAEIKSGTDCVGRQKAPSQPLNSVAAGSVGLGILSYGLANMIVSSLPRTYTNKVICGIHAISGAFFAGVAIFGANAISKHRGDKRPAGNSQTSTIEMG